MAFLDLNACLLLPRSRLFLLRQAAPRKGKGTEGHSDGCLGKEQAPGVTGREMDGGSKTMLSLLVCV